MHLGNMPFPTKKPGVNIQTQAKDIKRQGFFLILLEIYILFDNVMGK